MNLFWFRSRHLKKNIYIYKRRALFILTGWALLLFKLHIYFSLCRVCVRARVRTCNLRVCIFLCTSPWVHMLKPEELSVFLYLSPSSLRWVSYWIWILLDCLASKLLGSTSLHSIALELHAYVTMPSSYVGARDSSSDPHTCTASSLTYWTISPIQNLVSNRE